MQTQMSMAKVGQEAMRMASSGGVCWEKLAREAHFRPNALAELCGVSMRTLQRYFRAQYNQTVSDWLRELRLNEALTSLKDCDSIKEVAFELGYKQPSHFTRDFKKKFGVPPRAMVHPRYTRFPADAPTTKMPQ
ncbi:MAG: helix-turn-helix domain-containing protein [Limisphaerales bacterium]